MVTIDLTTMIDAPVQRCFDLARSIELHLSSTAETGEAAVSGTTSGLIGPGEWVRWRARHFGVWQHLTSRITAFDAPHSFQDTMEQGAFRFMQHDHLFSERADGGTKMLDHFVFAAPIPLFGRIAEELVLRRYMTGFLLERNAVLKAAAESDQWRRYLPGAAGA